MLRAVFFDLDGTLLPMDENQFTEIYFGLLYKYVKDLGYQKDELISVIWEGTKAMYKNDGSMTNCDAFWKFFEEHYGKERLTDKEIFDRFYVTDFEKSKGVCDDNPLAREIVLYAKNNLDYVVLSTNPIFPLNGTLMRMGFVGLKKEDFSFITAYENSRYTKPNPNYFLDLLEKFSLKPEEVILFGNNDIEDYYCAKMAGIDCYLVGNHLILHPDKHINCPVIQMEDVIDVINKEIEERK